MRDEPNEREDLMTIAGTLTPIEPLSRRQERDAIIMAQAGSREAAEALVCSQVRSLVRLVDKSEARESMKEDLFQVAVVALLEEIKAFDVETVPVRLWLRALPAIRGAMMDEIMNQGYEVSVPHTSAFRNDPTMGMRFSRDVALTDAISWDTPMDGDESITLGDVFADDYEGAIGATLDDKELVEALLARITNPNHVYILKASFGFYGKITDDEIAENLGIKRTAVVMARQRAIAKLKRIAE